MEDDKRVSADDSLGRIEDAYRSDRRRLVARLRRAGRSLEEAEDLVHEAYAEAVERLGAVPRIVNLPAWINATVGRRLVDAWRRDRVRAASGETDVAEETLREIVAGVGLDPADEAIGDMLADALDDALRALPPPQRAVLEAQVFGGKSFRQLAEESGESPDTLAARKRYAIDKLCRALRHWIDE